jgi:hypothetical protein
MPPSTFSRLGQSNAGANKLQLFKTQVTAEILKTFENEGPLDQFTTVRSITSGKSAIFPYIGNISGAYHTPGNELTGLSQIKAAEKIISVDGQYISHVWINSLDEVMDSYDLRSAYAVELGRALVRSQGYRLGRMLVRAARSTGVLDADSIQGEYKNYGASGEHPGTAADPDLTNWTVFGNAADNRSLSCKSDSASTAAATAAEFLGCIWNAVRILDTKNVPQNDRYIIMRPTEFYLLMNASQVSQGSGLIFNKDIGGTGSYAQATMPTIAGCSVVKTNFLPSTDFTTEAFANINPGQGGTGVSPAGVNNVETYANNNYNGDFSRTMAVVTNKQAVGTVKLLDMVTETEYYSMYQATLLLAKYAQGHGVLRPECACEITLKPAADTTGARDKFLPTA